MCVRTLARSGQSAIDIFTKPHQRAIAQPTAEHCMSKPAKPDPNASPLVSLLTSIGFTHVRALDAAKSPKTAAVLKDIIEDHGLAARSPLDDKHAGLIVALAVVLAKTNGLGHAETAYALEKILNDSLKSVDQVTGRDIPDHRNVSSLSLPFPSCCEVS